LNKRGTIRLFTLALLVSLALLGNQSHWLPSLHPAQAQGSTGVYITPQNITDLSKGPGSSFTVSVNVSESPPLNTFEVVLHYNHTILNVHKVDFTGTVLTGGNVFIFCIDGSPGPNSPGCKNAGEGIGVITLALQINKGLTPPIVAGRSLFQVTFDVVQKGLAQIVVHSVRLQTASPPDFVTTPVQPISSTDGFFTNADCPAGSGRACRPPTVRITVSPNPVPADILASFNATVIENNVGQASVLCLGLG
jgi:hypothetical protein